MNDIELSDLIDLIDLSDLFLPPALVDGPDGAPAAITPNPVVRASAAAPTTPLSATTRQPAPAPIVITLANAREKHRGWGAVIRQPGAPTIEFYGVTDGIGSTPAGLRALWAIARSMPLRRRIEVIVGTVELELCINGLASPEGRREVFSLLGNGLESACYRNLISALVSFAGQITARKRSTPPVSDDDGVRALELAQVAALTGQTNATDETREARIAAQKAQREKRKAQRKEHANDTRRKARAERAAEHGGRTHTRNRRRWMEPGANPYALAKGR